MSRLAALLGGDRPVLLDGGMGTLLQDSGLEDGAPASSGTWRTPTRSARRTPRTPRQARGC